MPQWVPVPLTGPAYTNIDADVLDTFSVDVRNAYVNEGGFTVKRPGLRLFADLGTTVGVDGLHWWSEKKLALAVSNGQIWKLTTSGGASAQMTSSAVLSIGTPTTFTTNKPASGDDEPKAYLANGGNIVATKFDGVPAALTDPDAPTAVTHVDFLDQYTLANIVDSAVWGNSEVAQGDVWRAIDRFSSESKPDNLLALHVENAEIALFGSRSVEFWGNDGQSPFSKLRGTDIRRGLGATYSVAFVGDSWIYIDDKRKLARIVNRAVQEASTPFDRVLQDLSRVDDAVAREMTIEGLPLYVISFPTDQRTLVYNYTKNDWSEWDFWDQEAGGSRRFLGATYAYAEPWNLHLLGDVNSGKIYAADFDNLSDNGHAIRTLRRTGHVSHGTMQEKVSHELIVRITRGLGHENLPAPKLSIRWRNDKGDWTTAKYPSLGVVGDHRNYFRLTGLGRYRTRQYEIMSTDNVPLTISEAKEFVDVL